MRELAHYWIADSYGGNQDWFTDLWMNKGGCGAVTACDSCIVLARDKGLRRLCPFDPAEVSRENFLAFGMKMKPYLRPRMTGINKTSLYIEGFSAYLQDCGETRLQMSSVEGDADLDTARQTIRQQIDAGWPVPYLMLLHRDKMLEDYNWHWFLLNGYDETDGVFRVRAVTYGMWRWLELARLWDTGHAEKGGLVVYRL